MTDNLSLFERVEDSTTITADDFLDRFQRFGFVWFKEKNLKSMPNSDDILTFLNENSKACEKSWTVENEGSSTNSNLMSPSNIKQGIDGSFYVSTIVHRNDREAFDALTKKLPDFSMFQDLHFTSGAWLFMGHVPVEKKRKRNLIGRAEHVDEVTHSGTYHVQLSGSKIWFIRPHPELFLEEMPSFEDIPGAEKSEATKTWRIKVEVQEGDVFVLNTKIWYHYTELPPADWSISVAQDFYLPVPCPQNVSEGDAIFMEEEIPEEMPRSSDPNCLLAEVEIDDGEGEEAKIVLVALRDIEEGELLFIAHDDEADGLTNANEMVDPRAIADKDCAKNQTVLSGDEIPNDMPRSMTPNCELVENGDTISLCALTDIKAGEIYCILPDEDGDYEEVEVDLSTGELKRDE